MEDDFENTKYEQAKYPYKSRALFAYLLHYQLKEVEELLAGGRYRRIANLCSGHGFELEYLSQFGKNIMALDISWNSLRRARENGRALGMNIEAICCDAENLPLRDNSFDFVLTHHSFHHLPQPLLGLGEMARISSYRMAFFEPAQGMMRTVVRKLGFKPEVEASGNHVYEFGRHEIEKFCGQHNLTLRHFHKCLITGPASEPSWFRRMDASKITPVVCGLISLANRGLGNVIGTKCSVVLEKTT
jgi:ubiquinone/menaquinone biosynthesis C-methylase UbiE